MRAREFCHRTEVVFNLTQSHWSSVARDVIRARKDHHHLRIQRNHIGAKANEHLRRGLTAYPTIDVRLARKEASIRGIVPGIRYRIAEEDDPLLFPGGRSDLAVVLFIACDVRPIFEFGFEPYNRGLS